MPKARGFIPFLVAGLAMMAGFHSPARAATTQPCISPAINASPGGDNFAPINGGTSTYCQSGFGWSDTWFPTAQPTSYDAHLDVLSGDNAPSLSYTVNETKVGTGNNFNFLSPFLDGGHLTSQNIGGGATFGTDIPPGPLTGSGSSTVNVGQVQVGITTTVNPNNSVTEAFTFTNTSTTDTVTGLTFDDYYNFHPDGSNGATDQFCGTTSFNPTTGTATTVGQVGGGCSPVVALGTIQGSALPTEWDLGNVGTVNLPAAHRFARKRQVSWLTSRPACTTMLPAPLAPVIPGSTSFGISQISLPVLQRTSRSQKTSLQLEYPSRPRLLSSAARCSGLAPFDAAVGSADLQPVTIAAGRAREMTEWRGRPRRSPVRR